MFEGVRRHLSVLKESWGAESERRRTKREFDQVEFLPAALEILEKPASPLGRTTLWVIVAFFSIAIAWATFGHVDVVASASGKLIPRDRVKLIQAAEIGVVRAIHVTDGQEVAAGDVLIELDPTFAGADEQVARRARQTAQVAVARTDALLTYLDGGTADFQPPEGTTAGAAAMQQRLIDARLNEYEASLAALQRQRAERVADLAVVGRELAKLEEMLPLLDQQLEARRELTEKGLSPRLLFLELQERYVAHVKDLEIQREQRIKMQAAIDSIDRQIEQLTQEFRKTVLGELAEAQDEAMMRAEELKKAHERYRLQRLVAPVDGIVQQLAVHTLGGVVQPAEPLMVVVPGAGELVVDAMVLNKDIGFVHEGDPVEVKLEAFSFTKYGVIHGRLEDLSTDAIQDETLGLVYQARVALDAQSIRVRDKDVTLAPGMAATAEIKTGKRRVVEFLLSPLLRYKDEALRER